MIRIAAIILAIAFLSMNAFAERQFAIYETKTGKKLSIDELAAKTVKSDIIFFGEFHDDSLIHKIQKEYLEALYKLTPKLAVSLEMFERDVQPVLDNFLSDKITEDEFLKNSRPWGDYKAFYKPLVDLAKANHAPVIAANIPRKYASVYTSDGWSGIQMLPTGERPYIASRVTIAEDEYAQRFYKTMLQNMGMDTNAALTPNQENTLYLYYGAQILKDETMAESIVNFLKNHKDMKVIHFNGDFHSNNYLGTVQKVFERNSKYKTSVLAPMYVEAGKSPDFDKSHQGDGDYLIVLEEKVREEMPQAMMGGHLGENYIASHKIKIKLTPSQHFLEGSDNIKFKNPISKSGSIRLLKDLKIENIYSPDAVFEYETKTDSLYQEIIIMKKDVEISNVNISYKGSIYHSPNVTLLNQKHSNTPGIISDAKGEGIYLPGGSYFPKADKDLADFALEITVPKELTIITSGILVSSKENNGNTIYHYQSELPTDEMTIVGGRYIYKDTVFDGKTFGLYTFEKSPAGESYLNASIQFYQYYTKLFGPYPYSSFKIVENFFATGFGMPGYTLLSNKLMAMPWIVLAPGSLAHEFVHNWWGNSIYVDYDAGNWCEALTTFSANYYYNVLTHNEAGALDWRKKALLSLEALPDANKYPLGKFKSQVNTDDAVIGYQKGGFMFYELYKIFGEEKFFNVLKAFAQKYKGKRATWMGFLMMFGMNAGMNNMDIPIKKIFDQWLKENTIPRLTLENVKLSDDSLSLNINQDSDFYMPVPVRIIRNSDTIWQTFIIDKPENHFSLATGTDVKSITVDPGYQCLRRLYKWEIPYSFGLTLGDNPLLIMPSKSSKDYPVAEKFVEMVKESDYKFDAKSIDDIKESDWANRSLIILGNSQSNPFYENMKEHYPENIDISGNDIFVNKQKFTSEGNLLLLNCANPKNPDRYISIIYCGNMDSPDQFRRLFHYQSYSMVLLSSSRMGKPLSQLEIFPAISDKRQMEHIFSE